jgi:hypothetical protein
MEVTYSFCKLNYLPEKVLLSNLTFNISENYIQKLIDISENECRDVAMLRLY